MDDNLKSIIASHRKLDIPIPEEPGIPEGSFGLCAIKGMVENIEEAHAGVKNGNVMQVMDALCLMQCLLDTAFIAFGLHNLKGPVLAAMNEPTKETTPCQTTH